MMERGAHALGCTVFAGGVGNTEQQLQAMADLRPHGYIGTPSFLRILLEKAAETGVAAAVADQGAGRRRGLPAQPARLAGASAASRLPVLRHRRPRPDRLRDRGARRPGARRGRDRRDRAPRHRRSGARRRGRRGGRHDAQPRLSADPLRHRRPVGGAARPLPDRPHQHRASRAGSAAPTRPTKVRGMFVHPSQVAEIARRHPEVRGRAWWSSGEMANDRMTLQVEVGRCARRPGRAHRRDDPRRDQAARRGRAAARPAACPTTAR